MKRPHETCGGLPVVRILACAAPRTRVLATGELTAAGRGRLGRSRAYLCRLDDGTGRITLAFSGRESVPGVVVGTRCRIEGTAQLVEELLVVWNPLYELLTAARPPEQNPHR